MSKGTEQFKVTIQKYLNTRAEQDSLFAETLKKENKNIDECINYILSEVQKSGCNGFADEEIFNMAVHYYDEDNIKAGVSKATRVVVNHSIELSSEEIEEAKALAKKEAVDKVIADQKEKMLKNTAKKKSETPKVQQVSLF